MLPIIINDTPKGEGVFIIACTCICTCTMWQEFRRYHSPPQLYIHTHLLVHCTCPYHTVRWYCVYRDGPGLASIIVYLRMFYYSVLKDDHFQFVV